MRFIAIRVPVSTRARWCCLMNPTVIAPLLFEVDLAVLSKGQAVTLAS